MNERKPKKRRKPKPLRPGEARFVAESLKPGLSKVEAARRAGLDYVPNGPKVERFREELLESEKARAIVSVERTLFHLAALAYSDLGYLYDAQGRLIPPAALDPLIRKALRTVEAREEYDDSGEAKARVLKYTLHSKEKALELLMRYQKLLDGTAAPGRQDRFQEVFDALRTPLKEDS